MFQVDFSGDVTIYVDTTDRADAVRRAKAAHGKGRVLRVDTCIGEHLIRGRHNMKRGGLAVWDVGAILRRARASRAKG